MRTFVLVAILAPLASGASLRYRGKPQLGARRCKPYKSLLEEKNILVPSGPAGSGLGKRHEDSVVADGYSRIGCENDIAPESQRISFKEHACGDPQIKTCRLTELGMTPRLCFDFCRQYENAKFFGLIHGRDCYCSVYYHAHTTGGGECDAHCEGDDKEMCGGMEKSSLFEMHMCQDTASEADAAISMSDEVAAREKAMQGVFNIFTFGIQDMAESWKLGVCSVKPEGERVCALNGEWTKMSNDLKTVASESAHKTEVLGKETAALTKLLNDKSQSAEAMSAVELATVAVRDAAAAVSGSLEVMQAKLNSVVPTHNTAAPSKSTLDLVTGKYNGKDVYKPLGTPGAEEGYRWYAVCALEPIPGEFYAMPACEDELCKEPLLGACADRCLDLSTGTNACAAFNYQVKTADGNTATGAYCQMLTANGVVEQEDAINSAVPIFEVSESKRNEMGISNMGCMAHGRFTAGHPKGPLGTKVIRQVTK